MTPWHVIRARTRDAAERFQSALLDSAGTQRAALESILSRHATSAFGRHHRFDTIADADDFRARLPIQRYEDFAGDIHSVCELGSAVSALTSEPVVMCEQTSGTVTSPRLIPYTESALEEFHRAIHPWLYDVVQAWPQLADGRAYFAISPVLSQPRQTAAGIPLGAGNDAIYLGSTLAEPFERLSVVPSRISDATQLDTWRYLTLRCLLAAADLSLISIWSPSFFTTLLDALPRFGDRLAHDIEIGCATAPDGTDAGLCFEPNPARARAVRAALAARTLDATLLWPRLALVSCWTHGSAARFVPALAAALPQAAIQGKGLLATEGVVSVPLANHDYPILAVRSGFFEFLDEYGNSLLADEVSIDSTYRVLLTTHAGLYRYNLGDCVRVRGFVGDTPTLEFIGRGDSVSDLCGEKITEAQVQHGLEGVTGFALLAPDARDRPRYRLVLDETERDTVTAQRLANTLDRRLRLNPHYNYARKLGQLGPIVADTRPDPLATYLRWQTRRGRRLGDIKPPVLYARADLETMFEAE